MKSNEFKKIEKYCKCCGEKLKLNNTRDILRKNFCSKKCNASFLLKELWKNEDFSSKIKILSSKPNPKKASRKFTIPLNKCNNCGKEIRKRIGKSGLIYCCRKCYDEYRKNNIVPREDRRKNVNLVCVICGKSYTRHISTSKGSKYCSMRCHNIGNYINMKKKDTDIEIILENTLKELNIDYKKQKQISNKTIADFFIYPNILIYADGEYWHNLPQNIVKDNIINEYLKHHGYKVIRYNGNDIKNNIDEIKINIKNNIE